MEETSGNGNAYDATIIIGGGEPAPDPTAEDRIAGLEAKVAKLRASLEGAERSLAEERAAQGS